MYYQDDVIENIRQSNDIVDVVGSYVKIKRHGSVYVGLCPFHNEKSPSFSVNPRMQIFKCFGCGKAGNVFGFIMEYENMTFPESIQLLADRAGIKLPEANYSGENRKAAKLRNDILEINKKAAIYFHKMLRSPEGAIGYNYFKERALSDEIILKFGLGYAPPRGSLYRMLKDEGYSDEVLRASELFNYNEKSGAYDKFWNRVMFPIMDKNSKVIAFGGRIMNTDDKSGTSDEQGGKDNGGRKIPKYLNSNETSVFEKGKNLYALNIAKKSKSEYLLLCEGYMDVIALHQAGFDNAIASLGTALTGNQARLMSRYTKKVYITYDSDGAGKNAALRAIPILKAAGITSMVINMKPYKDPDEFIKALGREEYERRIDEALTGFEFEAEAMAAEYDLEVTKAEDRTKFINALAKKMLDYPDELERFTYCEAVCKKYNIPPDLFKGKVNRLAAGLDLETRNEKINYTELTSGLNTGSYNRNAERRALNKNHFEQEKLLLTWCMENSKYMRVMMKYLEPDDFQEGIPRKVAQLVYERFETDNRLPTPAAIIDGFETTDEQAIVADLFQTEIWNQIGDDERIRNKAFSDAICKAVENSLKNKIEIAKKSNDGNLLIECTKKKMNLEILGKNILKSLE